MILLASAPNWLATLLLLLLTLAALEDLWRLEINDWLGGAVAASAFLAVAMNGPAGELWQNLLLFPAVRSRLDGRRGREAACSVLLVVRPPSRLENASGGSHRRWARDIACHVAARPTLALPPS